MQAPSGRAHTALGYSLPPSGREMPGIQAYAGDASWLGQIDIKLRAVNNKTTSLPVRRLKLKVQTRAGSSLGPSPGFADINFSLLRVCVLPFSLLLYKHATR